MVYLYYPRHPDSDHRGLWEVLAVPSPTFFHRFPQYDIEVTDEMKEHKGKWTRGYSTFFKALMRMKDPSRRPIISKGQVFNLLPSVFEKFDSEGFKRMLNEKNKTDFQRKQEKLQSVLKPIKGWGDPVHGRREKSTAYSFA